MLKKVLIGAVALVAILSIGLFFWARSVLSGDAVRTAVASQLSQALGQPVTVGGVSASVYPRVTMTLGQVRIGEPAAVEVGSLHVGTDFGALLSRRIEHAALRITDAHIHLPLPPFALGGSGSAATTPTPGPEGPPPVELVSIDEITLSGVEITSGGRTLRGDIEVVPRSDGGLDVRKVSLAADDTTIEITGAITDLSRPAGELALKAGSLDFDALMAFLTDFSSGAVGACAGCRRPEATAAVDPTASLRASSPAEAPAVPAGIDIALTVDADRASFGDLVLDKVSGKARLTPAGLTLNPIAFGVFGGQADGSLALTLADPPAFALNAKLAGVDMASVMTFAGTPGLVTGTMAGTLALQGSGTAADDVLKTARGSAHVESGQRHREGARPGARRRARDLDAAGFESEPGIDERRRAVHLADRHAEHGRRRRARPPISRSSRRTSRSRPPAPSRSMDPRWTSRGRCCCHPS